LIKRSKHRVLARTCVVLFCAVSLFGTAVGSGRRVTDKTQYVFTMTKPNQSVANTFEDEFIKIMFAISPESLRFSLTNKSDNPIKLKWNESAYVDANSESHRVMHAGVRYIERDKELPPTIIPPNAKVSDLVIPVDQVRFGTNKWYESQTDRHWYQKPLFPKPDKKEASAYKGRSFSVFFPLEIDGQVKNYTFTFTIEITQA
jgi:hypothetical protein